MEQINRIIYMEQILDEASAAAASLSEALEKYSFVQNKLAELSDYYGSKQWIKDFEDDSAGRLPDGLKRGVLSEDAVHDLLAENVRLKKRMSELCAR